jgi:hypothetical protein
MPRRPCPWKIILFCLNLPVCLPDSFDSGSQSISTKFIKITHGLVVKAKFQNTHGLISTEVSGYLLKEIAEEPCNYLRVRLRRTLPSPST